MQLIALALAFGAVFTYASPMILTNRENKSPSTNAPPNCPAGNPHPSYKINQNDTCISISRAAHISTLDFIAVNEQYGLNENCTNLAIGQTVCLPPMCDAYLVQDGDTCANIASKHNLTLSAFWDHNPGLDNPSCSNLLSGTTVCLSKPSGSQFPAPQNPSSNN